MLLKAEGAMVMRMSIMGFAGRRGMEVLPMCSMAKGWRSASARSDSSSDFTWENCWGQLGLGGEMMISMVGERLD